MNIISQVAKSMQEILTKTADIIAGQTGFIQRLRKLTGSGFIQTLIFGWLSNPTATLEELTQTAATLGISITPQGLDKRFTPICANFIKKVLESAVGVVIAQKPVAIQLLHRFSAVYIQDSSTITLPDVLAVIWKGCGGSTTKNTSSSIKTQIRLNLNTGELTGPYLQSGKENDLRSQLSLRPMPKGSLWIADLGYFSLASFKDLHSQGIYWLSRVKSLCNVYYGGNCFSLLKLLEEQCNDNMDIEVMLGAKERVPCRLIAVRVPDEVARIRRCKMIQEAQRRRERLHYRV